jgi:hypothetical protein
VEDFCDHGNEPLGYIKYWEILEWRNNWWPLKKSLAPRSLLGNHDPFTAPYM